MPKSLKHSHSIVFANVNAQKPDQFGILVRVSFIMQYTNYANYASFTENNSKYTCRSKQTRNADTFLLCLYICVCVCELCVFVCRRFHRTVVFVCVFEVRGMRDDRGDGMPIAP